MYFPLFVGVKDKGKEALFNVAYNVAEKKAHELFCDTTISLIDTYLLTATHTASLCKTSRAVGSVLTSTPRCVDFPDKCLDLIFTYTPACLHRFKPLYIIGVMLKIGFF